MSPFGSLLDELMKGVRADEASRSTLGFSWDFLDGMMRLQRAAVPCAATASRNSYESLSEPLHPAIELPPADRDTIADELGLYSGMTLDELGRIRRRFACQNHPDRFPPYLRDRATARMMTANTLIDEAEDARRRRSRARGPL